MDTSATRIALLTLCLFLGNQFATASTGGISGFTGTATCSNCHSAIGTALLPTTSGTVELPANVTANTFISGKSYPLSFVNVGEVSAAGAGFNMGDSLTNSVFAATTGTAVQSGGNEISHSNANNFSWSFDWVANEVTSNGEFQWCTTRTDNTGSTSRDGPHLCGTQAFTVVANQAPSAAAGGDQTVSEGTLVSLDGTGSTDEFPDLAYAWTQTSGPTVTLINADTATPTFTAPDVAIAGGSVTLSLEVTEVEHDDLTDTDTVVINITNINQAPVANAGPDQSVAESAAVTLDGTGTTDPDVDDTLTYLWSQTSGPTVTLSSTSSPSPTFTSPSVMLGGATLVFELTVTDLELESTSDSVIITVVNDNEPPVAVAGPDQSVNEGTLVTLDGASSTDETPSSLMFSWVQLSGPSVSITNSTTSTPSIVAPEVGFDGVFDVTIQLTVTDAFSLSTTDTVVVTSANVNLAPTANAGPDQTVGEDVEVQLTGSASTDPDLAVDDVLTYAWTQTGGIAVTLSGETTATPTFQSPFVGAVGGSSTFSLTITDRGTLQSSDSIVVTFTDGNTPPVANAGTNQTIDEGSTVALDGSGSTDNTPSTMQFAWSQVSGPSVSIVGANTATPSFTAPEVGFDGLTAVTLSLNVTDEETLTDSDTVIVTITNVNQPPVANAGADQTVAEAIQVTLNGTASTDPDIIVDDALTYAWTQTGGISVSLAGATSATPTFQSPSVPAAGGTSTFSLTVTDRGSLQNSDTVVVSFTDGNTAPVANAGANQTVDEGSNVALNGSASTDNIPATLQFAWTQVGGPSISLVGANTATPSFTAPEVGFDGLKTITLSLTTTDEESLSSSDTVSVTVTNVNKPPVASAGNDQTVGENVTVSLNGTASSDPDIALDDTLTYAWTQTSGISVTLTGATTATPTFQSPSVGAIGGTSTFSLTVTDRGSLQNSDSIVVTFSDGNLSPVANAGADQAADEGSTVALDGGASTDDVQGTLQYAWSQASGPSVTLIGADSTTPSFTAPDVGFDGATAVVLSLLVTDEESLQSTDTVTININNINQPPVASAGSDQTIGENTQVTLDGSASTDPDIALDDVLSYSWVQTAGTPVTLAAPTTVNPTFQSPTVNSAGGTATFALTVTDRGTLQDTDTVVVTFSDDNLAPVANAGVDQTVNESTTVALNGSASTDDVQGTLQYAWSQVSGPSITIIGAMTASPSFTAPEVGFDGLNVVTLSLLVTDEETLTDTDLVIVNVTNVNRPPVANAGAPQSVAQDTTVTLNGSLSSDPDAAVDDFLLYAWTQTNGPAVTLTNPTTATASFTSPSTAATGQALTFQLTVTDRGAETDTASVVISLLDPENQAPSANAGSSVEVVEQMTVTLDGSNSSDADGTIALYQWTQIAGPIVNLQQPDQAITSFSAPEVGASSATLTFQLQVTDDDSAVATSLVDIYVRETAGVLAPVAAVLPSSRSATISGQVGAFATILNPSNIPLTGCSITPTTTVPASYSFFSTDPATNGIVGASDTPVDIPANSARTFALFFTPTGAFSPTDMEFAFACGNAPATQIITGVNTLLLSAATTVPADVIALVATPSADGVVRLPGPDGVQAFGAATANVGTGAVITATLATSTPGLNLSMSVCETNSLTGECLNAPEPEATSTLAANGTATYSVFVSATGDVAFDPANNRVRVLFMENGVVRGSTSVAVTTQ